MTSKLEMEKDRQQQTEEFMADTVVRSNSYYYPNEERRGPSRFWKVPLGRIIDPDVASDFDLEVKKDIPAR